LLVGAAIVTVGPLKMAVPYQVEENPRGIEPDQSSRSRFRRGQMAGALDRRWPAHWAAVERFFAGSLG
jgi:hypothetical protein